MRIGLFGGSFDPVHNAHVALAREALHALQLDELRWVPAGNAWQKARALTAAAQREAMLRLALAGEPRFKLELCELRREGPSYTLDTVRELQAAQPGAKWFLIIGHDQYCNLHTWAGFEELLSRVQLAVANRQGTPGAPGAPSPEVQKLGKRIVPLPMMNISSTAIRELAAQGGDLGALVPSAVARYIELHRLYRPTAGTTGS